MLAITATACSRSHTTVIAHPNHQQMNQGWNHTNVVPPLIQTRHDTERKPPSSAFTRMRSSLKDSADTRNGAGCGARSVQPSGNVTVAPDSASHTKTRPSLRRRCTQTRNRLPRNGWNGCVTTSQCDPGTDVI